MNVEEMNINENDKTVSTEELQKVNENKKNRETFNT